MTIDPNFSVSKSKIIFDGRTILHDDLVLTDEDRHFAEKLARQQIIVLDELKQGVRIAAKWSWVGVVKFSNFELHIKPRLSGLDPDAENLALAEMLDFISDRHDLKIIRRPHNFDAAGTNLFELIIASFADACEEIVKKGVLADYVLVEEQLPVLRGSLLLLKQLRSRSGRFDRLECLHDDYTTDICENKLLLAALLACVGKVKSQNLRAQIHRLTSVFEEAADLHESEFNFNEAYKTLLQGGYNRLNNYYRRSHALASLIMAGMGYKNVFATGKQQCFAFLFKMSEVFEKFVSKLLTLHLNKLGYKVYSQKEESKILWNSGTNSSYASLRPDMIVENKSHPGILLPVDAKYKNYDERHAEQALDANGDEFAFDELAKKVSTQDIYQTFTYAHGFGHGQHTSSPTSMIAYSSSSPDATIKRIHVRRRIDDSSRGAIIVVPINIKNELAALKLGHRTTAMDEAIQSVTELLGIACSS